MRAERTKAKDHATFAASLVILACAAASGFATGCVASENVPPARGYVVNGPPPPPIAESRPAPPAAPPNAPPPVWVAGYWHWVGVQYAWIPGHWEEPPAGARWAAPQYSLRDGTYFYAPGDWQRAPGAPPASVGAPAQTQPQTQQVLPQAPPSANAFH